MIKKLIVMLTMLSLPCVSFGATRAIVPRANGEGSIGVSGNAWGSSYLAGLNLSGAFNGGGNSATNIANIQATGSLSVSNGITQSATTVTNNILASTNYFAGKVGIGTSTPGTALTVKTDENNSCYRAWRNANGAGFGHYAVSIALNDSSSAVTDYAYLGGGIVSNTAGAASGYISLGTRKVGTITEALRIDQNGNVGIGTTAPNQALHVVGNINIPQGNYLMSDQSTTVSNSIKLYNAANGQMQFETYYGGANGGYEFRVTPGKTNFVITGSGGVKIVPVTPFPTASPGLMYFDGTNFFASTNTTWFKVVLQ